MWRGDERQLPPLLSLAIEQTMRSIKEKEDTSTLFLLHRRTHRALPLPTPAPLNCARTHPINTNQQKNSATKKQGGSTSNRGNQLPKMLGVKLGGGAPAKAGAIVVRQRGTRVHPGPGVGMVRIYTVGVLLSPGESARERERGWAREERKRREPLREDET